jgi:hypothetical protein
MIFLIDRNLEGYAIQLLGTLVNRVLGNAK